MFMECPSKTRGFGKWYPLTHFLTRSLVDEIKWLAAGHIRGYPLLQSGYVHKDLSEDVRIYRFENTWRN